MRVSSVGGHTPVGSYAGHDQGAQHAQADLSLAAVATAAVLALTACGGVETTTGGDDGGEYPSGSVEMYVGADPGGSSDLISRQVATGLTNELGETFSVINRSGSNGALAAAEVEQAEPDGNIIAVQNASLFAITPLAVAEDEVTDIEDFDVVGGVSRDDYVLVTNSDNDWSSIEDLKGAGKKVTYGTTGVGTGCAALLRAHLLDRRHRLRGRALRRWRTGTDRAARQPGRHRLPAGRRGPGEHRERQARPPSRSSPPSASTPSRTCPPPRSRASTSRSTSTAS